MSESKPISEIDALQRECAQLRQRVAVLEEALQFLAYCKQTEPSFAFYDWLVKNQVFDEHRARLELVLGVLEDRLASRPFTFQRTVSGISDDQLYQHTRPTSDHARTLLMLALETRNTHTIDELFQALASQGRNRELVAWWLAEQTADRNA